MVAKKNSFGNFTLFDEWPKINVAGAPFGPGDLVQCVDAKNHAWFLRVGEVYEVCQTQLEPDGKLRLCLIGMASAWPMEQFKLHCRRENRGSK